MNTLSLAYDDLTRMDVPTDVPGASSRGESQKVVNSDQVFCYKALFRRDHPVDNDRLLLVAGG